GCALCFAIAVQETEFWFSYYTSYQLGFARPRPLEQLGAKVGHADLPVVVADGHDYIEWNHYSPAAVRRRLVYIADPAAAAAYGRSDTTEKEVAVLPEFADLRVVTLQEFVDTHSQFLLYSRVSWENNPDWWVLRLLADGYSVKKLAGEGDS